MDNRVRPEHAALHGKIAHRDDKFWATNYPPNGWNCRCAVEFVSKDEMDAHGWSEMSDIEKRLNFAEDDWAYDTRGLNNPTQYLQDIIKDKLELYKQKHASGAVLALNAVKDKLVQNEGRYQTMKKLWNSEDLELTANVCKINKDLKDKMGATAQYISIKAETMESHKEFSKYKPPKGVKMPNPHPEITAFDYSIIPFMLESDKKQLFRDGEKIYIVASRLGIYYRLVLKNLPEKKEVWVSSLMSREKKEDLLPNLKGKKEIK